MSRSCKTKYCRGTPQKYRKYCPKCRSRQYKKSHPFRYHFNYHRLNARRRGIPFELSFKDFKNIWLRSGRWEEKKLGASWEMHRLESDKGYTKDNIVIIKKYLHVLITAIENGWEVDFEYKGYYRTEEQEKVAKEIYGEAPF